MEPEGRNASQIAGRPELKIYLPEPNIGAQSQSLDLDFPMTVTPSSVSRQHLIAQVCVKEDRRLESGFRLRFHATPPLRWLLRDGSQLA